jgi:predicted Zn-dependent peptidase
VLGTRFGSIDRVFENKNGKNTLLPAGTAHFLEHKMFENADGTNSDECFAALGAEDNAYTSYSTTRYLFSTTRNFNECLTQLVRFVMNPYFTKKSVKKEQGIITQEIKMGEDSPWTCGTENMLRGLFSKSGLRDPICGSESSILKITDKILYSAHEAFYTPDNMALSVCGDIDCDTVIEIVDRELEGISAKTAARSVQEEEPNAVHSEKTVKYMNISRPLVFFGFKDDIAGLSAKEREKRRAGMSLVNNMLFSSSGEFYNRLVSEKLVSPSFSFGYTMSRTAAYNSFFAESDRPEYVCELIRNELQRASKEGFSNEDFERCRRVATAGYIRLFDSAEEIADDVMMNSWFSSCEPFETPNTINSLTLDYCEQLLFEAFINERSTVSLIKPFSQKGNE